MSKIDKNKDNGIQITEMFMAEADGKCFYGNLIRSQDANGNPHLYSIITVNDGLIQACASDLKELGRLLDEMCLMYLNGLHRESGNFIEIYTMKYFLN
ncbi:MAG: hypothetical protein BWX96_00640 [Bacteroidetes bacterium ADurb.Bin145]|jgi:hypothetical protein|nr:MAG: hypothetical protein BWX96_00640 [Bacteroidetes bacterium ADurb.Bin145]